MERMAVLENIKRLNHLLGQAGNPLDDHATMQTERMLAEKRKLATLDKEKRELR